MGGVMDANEWDATTDWIALWKSLSSLPDADRKLRLIANELCRPLLRPATDPVFHQLFTMSEARVRGEVSGDAWDEWEDLYAAAEAAARAATTVVGRAIAWTVVGLGNDDHKLGRMVESLLHFYGCLAAIRAGVLQPDESVAEGRGLQTDRSYVTGRDETGPRVIAHMIREHTPNPFHPVAFSPSWRTEAVVGLARTMYESRDFAALPVLADALDDAGCDQPDILAHCRGPGLHVRGCWVVDLVLGKT